MTGRTMVSGAPRAVWAVATLTTRQLVRERTFLALAGLFWIYMAFQRTPEALDERAGVVHFLEKGMGGASIVVLLAGALFAVGATGSAHRERVAAALAARTIGPASWYWGRLIGISSVLVLLSILCSVMVALLFQVRFGSLPADDITLSRWHASTVFEPRTCTIWLRGDRSAIDLDFDVAAEDLEDRVVRGRIFPRLAVRQEGGPLRGHWPMRIRISEPGDDWEIVRVLPVSAGREARFEVLLPPRRAPQRIRVRLEKTQPEYSVKLYRRDVALLGKRDSAVLGIARGAIVLGLFASVLAGVVLFAVQRIGPVASLAVAVGVVASSTSMDIIDGTVLTVVDSGVRDFILGVLRALLPDFDAYDVSTQLARRASVPWATALDLLARLGGTAVAGGVFSGLMKRTEAVW